MVRGVCDEELGDGCSRAEFNLDNDSIYIPHVRTGVKGDGMIALTHSRAGLLDLKFWRIHERDSYQVGNVRNGHLSRAGLLVLIGVRAWSAHLAMMLHGLQLTLFWQDPSGCGGDYAVRGCDAGPVDFEITWCP